VTTEVTFTGQSGAMWRYWTDRPLGKPGGFGAVYEAEGKDGTPMAVKEVTKQRPAGALDDRLLRREIDVGRRVSESGSYMLLPVIDAADTGDALLLVMARAGDPLTAVTIPMGEPEAIAVMTDIATGLLDLHSIAIIHRDLKPPNVLHHDGRWKLADFGIARDQEIGTQDPTFVGWGSRHYMAPELWELKSPTIKTDLYAFGCLGFELLAGTPPYTGDEAAIRAGHLTQAPPDVPCSNIKLKNLITRLIAKKPADRPQDARAVLERLSLAQLTQGPVLEAIGRGLGQHETERSRAAADRAAAEAAADARRQQIAQANADLREIISDALQDLQTVEPDVTLQEQRSTTRSSFAASPTLTLSTASVRLHIEIWEGMTSHEPVADDTMILAASVTITNPRHPTELISANLVYEQVGDRLGWQVYKFLGLHPPVETPDGRVYGPYGPYGRTHGLRHREFFHPNNVRRPFGLTWRLTVRVLPVTPLTADTALELFQEAVDLQPPNPRTGVYSGPL
jgi:serine/threonine protein kinase